MLRLIWGLFVTLIWQSCLHFTYWITIRWFSRTSNTVVLNIFHSVNNFLFSSAKPHHFVGMLGIGLPVSMYTTKTPIDKCRFNVTQIFYIFCKRQISIKLFYLYQRFQYTDNYFFKITFVFISLFTAVSIMKGKQSVLIYFCCQIDSRVSNTSIYYAIFLASPYYNFL